MKARVICTCRGDGRGYMSVQVTRFSQDARLKLAGFTDENDHAPTQLYVIDEDDTSKTAVLVFPLAPVTIKLKLDETAPNGDATNSCTFTIQPSALKWQSRINYRLKDRECARIRDIDGTDFFRHATIILRECIPSDNANILRGTITVPTVDDIPYSIKLLDGRFRPIDSSFIVMSDSVEPESSMVPMPVRRIDFSVRIPKPIATYVVSFEDPSGSVRTNFATLEPQLYETLLAKRHEEALDATHDTRYPQWLDRHRADDAVIKEQRNAFLKSKPLISIVTPLFRTPLKFFREMASSVLEQTYGNFELILVNADPDNDDLAKAIKNLANRDDRVKEVRLEKNLGISLNSAQGIAAAQGDYIAFLDHDDLLEPNALFEYASAINVNENIDLLYCDEDKLFPDGTYGDPYFKPDFSPHLLREVNYVCHLLMVRNNLLARLAPADPIFDGAQDHRMILQAVEKGARIHHVPSVLYHWRISENSTASGTGEKPYADKAGKLAIEEHLQAMAIPGKAHHTEEACRYHIEYHVTGKPLVSIIIPNKDNAEVLDTCLSSILDKSTYDHFEIIVVENNSTEASTFDYYENAKRRDPRIKIATWKHEFNFSKLINFGAQHARGEFLLLLNNDTEVISPFWIESMLGISQEPTVGAVGAKLYYRDGTIQHAGVYVQGTGAGHLNSSLDRNEKGYYHTASSTREVSAVTAACVLTKRKAFEEVGGFSEEFAVAFNDVDFCLKLRAKGYSIVFAPEAELYHYESLSRGYETTVAKQMRFHREASLLNATWPEYFVIGDPYMNRNLHPSCGYFRLDDRDLN